MTMTMDNGTEVEQAIKVRRATPAHRDGLAGMYRVFEPKGAAFGLPPLGNPDRWLDRLSGHPNFIALAENQIVGHSVLCPETDSAELAIFVHQSFRRRGLGKRLTHELIVEAQRLGLRSLWAMVELTNIPIVRLLRSFGFVRGQELGEFHLHLEKPTLTSF